MNFPDWYTDRMDVYRVVDSKVGNLTQKARQQLLSDIPCRIYQDNDSPPSMKQDAASVRNTMKVACSNDYDIHAGDELILSRGGGVGVTGVKSRAFAGDPHHHYEPFGAVIPGLAHQEIILLEEERI